MNSLETILEEREKALSSYEKKIRKAYKECIKRNPESRADLNRLLLKKSNLLNVGHALVKSSAKYGGLGPISSFKAMLTARTRKQQLAGREFCHEWALNDKRGAYRFLDILGIRRPKIDSRSYSIDSLDFQEMVAIKPSSGVASRGVYLVYAHDDILDVKKSKKIGSYEEMKECMRADLENKVVGKDEWIVEELILGDTSRKTPSTDLKFLCFYGEVALVREISRYPKVLDCWWDANGNLVETGQQLDKKNKLKGLGVSESQITLVSEISKEVPAPFLRIDFLLSDNKLVFGEFTPRPGSYAEFDHETDRLLGDYFLDAEARLVGDLLNGKAFKAYRKFLDASSQA